MVFPWFSHGFPIKNSDFPQFFVCLPEANHQPTRDNAQSYLGWQLPAPRSPSENPQVSPPAARHCFTKTWVISHVPIFHITQPWSVYSLLDAYYFWWCPIFPSHGTFTNPWPSWPEKRCPNFWLCCSKKSNMTKSSQFTINIWISKF